MVLFSKRNAPVADRYTDKIPQEVRSRILHTLKDCVERSRQPIGFSSVLQDVERQLLMQHGTLRRVNGDPSLPAVLGHFFGCNDEEAIDFLKVCFATQWNCGGNLAVDAINRIFEEEGIDYAFTRTAEPQGYGIYRIIPPEPYKKGEQRLHREVVKPCLSALNDARFGDADKELRDAFDAVRSGKYSDAITASGSALESVLKSICTEKGWTYDRDGDTLSKLVEACQKNGLFPGFYRPIFEGVGTIRNKIGDAHGRAQSPHPPADREAAEHMINLTCAHINLLLSRAAL